ncbi:hypothetical protein ACFL7D_05085 [candidate division KSB1 bacterium]
MTSCRLLRLLCRSILIFCIVVAFGDDGTAQKPRKEYIKNSHLFHLDETDLECVACHKEVSLSISSSDRLLPKCDTCLECHDGKIARNKCDICHFDEKNVTLMPKNKRVTNFSHKTHIEQKDSDCNTCHVGMKKTDYSTIESVPIMYDCKRCHNTVDAPENCDHCHFTPKSLRPNHHDKAWIYTHKFAKDDLLTQCSMCHMFIFCQDCHTEALLINYDPPTSADGTRVSFYNWDMNKAKLGFYHEEFYENNHSYLSKDQINECIYCHGEEIRCKYCHYEPRLRIIENKNYKRN